MCSQNACRKELVHKRQESRGWGSIKTNIPARPLEPHDAHSDDHGECRAEGLLVHQLPGASGRSLKAPLGLSSLTCKDHSDAAPHDILILQGLVERLLYSRHTARHGELWRAKRTCSGPHRALQTGRPPLGDAPHGAWRPVGETPIE